MRNFNEHYIFAHIFQACPIVSPDMREFASHLNFNKCLQKLRCNLRASLLLYVHGYGFIVPFNTDIVMQFCWVLLFYLSQFRDKVDMIPSTINKCINKYTMYVSLVFFALLFICSACYANVKNFGVHFANVR